MVLALAVGVAGCSSGPKPRLGSLPFPGIPLLYMVADPDDLGEHRYHSTFSFLDKEHDRGIVYTTQAGFIDISHVRDTADWTRYVAERVEPALLGGKAQLDLETSNRTWVHLEFNYPPGWEELSESERRELAFDLAILIAQDAAYAVATFHEVITWFGYSTVPLISEKHSAFTYDDMVAHVLGVRVAEAALRDKERHYNEAVTRALYRELDRVGALSPEETRQAIEAVKGKWWVRGKAIKRHLDSGYPQREIRPVLIPDFAEEAVLASATIQPAGATLAEVQLRTAGEPFALPSIDAIDGRGLDLGNFYQLELGSTSAVWGKLLPYLPEGIERIDPDVHIPWLTEVVREQMRKEISPTVDDFSLDEETTDDEATVRAQVGG